MKLKNYYLQSFKQFECTAFGPLWAQFKTSFKPSYYLCYHVSTHEIKYLIDHDTKIKIENIFKITDKAFKDFILSLNQYQEYDNCRALKKVLNVDKLVEKFADDEQYSNIRISTKVLLNHIDEKAYVYNAISNSLEGSAMEHLPKEIIGHIFHYVNGDIELSNQV